PSYGPTANSNGYTFGTVFIPGSTLGSLVNTALAWEEQKQMNVGFDLGAFNNKLSLSADYFEKRVNGQLFTPSLPWVLGQIPAPQANIGSTKSNGFEFTLGYNDFLSKDLKFGTILTFTKVK
ncbi:MAG TPA: TonB-dependent receptor, partial [Ferruginibacter sp.]|nr:TonB-dependent receptor [Ferruginibacter sp.]